MKRFTSLMLMLLCAVTTWAQTLVTDATTISNEKVYTLAPSNTSSTGVICVPGTDATMLYMSTHASATQNIDETNINQRFAFLTTTNGKTYMYSLGAQKFVAKKQPGTTLVEKISTDCEITFLPSTGTAKENYPLVVAVGGQYLCISNASWWADNGYVLTNWNDAGDAGCMMAVVAYDPTSEELELIASAKKILSTVEIATIDAEYNAAKASAQVVLERELASNDEIAAIETALGNAETAYAALEITDGTISDADATSFREFISAINVATDAARYLTSLETLSNEFCYTVQTQDRGAWYSDDAQLNSTGKLEIDYDVTVPEQQFAFIKSSNNRLYLYSVAKGQFVSKDGNFTTLTDEPVQCITILNGTRSAAYPWVVALNGEYQLGVSNSYEYGVISFYNDLSDAGNTVRFEKAATFDATAALEIIEEYESVALVEEWKTRTLSTLGYVGGYPTTMEDDINSVSTYAETIAFDENNAAERITLVAGNYYRIQNVYRNHVVAVNTNSERISADLNKASIAQIWQFEAGATDGTYLIKSPNAEAYMLGAGASNILAETGAEFEVYNLGVGYAQFNLKQKNNNTLMCEYQGGGIGSWTGGGLNSDMAWFLIPTEEIEISLSDIDGKGWATAYLPFDVTLPEDLTAYYVNEINNGYVTLSETADVPANNGVILSGTPKTYTLTIADATSEITSNYLDGTFIDDVITKEEGNSYYILANGEEGIGFYNPVLGEDETKFNNAANKAYLVVPAEQAEGIACYSFRFGEGTTGVEEVTDNREQSTVIYDLTGRRVETITAPGIYIVNGVKRVIR